MIKRFGLEGIDNGLLSTLITSFEYLDDRIIYHPNNEVFYEMLELMKGQNYGNNNTYSVEFERHCDKIIIEISKFYLDISYVGVDSETIGFSEFPIYEYRYQNTDKEYPIIEEDGSYFIFSEKLLEHLMGIDIDCIKLKQLK